MHGSFFRSMGDWLLFGAAILGLIVFSGVKLDALINGPKDRLRRLPPTAGTGMDDRLADGEEEADSELQAGSGMDSPRPL